MDRESSPAVHHGSSEAPQTTDVLLISMPFGPLSQPSIGLSLLKGAIEPLGCTAEIRYLTIPFAKAIGPALYTDIALGKPSSVDLVGEWIFSGALFDQPEADVARYLDDILRRRALVYRNGQPVDEAFIADVLAARARVERFLDECVDDLLRRRPRIVGFTSIFQQQVASLALARRLKQRAPELFTLIGGANCEGIMAVEVVRQFPFIDAVVSGEGDLVFPELVSRVLAGKPIDQLQGVYTRTNIDLPTAIDGKIANAPSVRDMDALPTPDYGDFFAQLDEHAVTCTLPVRILYETSRGCWWGEKNHCTFCGLNGSTMAYRSKSAGRALDELLDLAGRHPDVPISVVDNILDMQYFKDFIPALVERRLDLDLFYEVKANLRKEQVRMLRRAGITAIQPGIESLSDTVLNLMGKGVRALQNIQLLKWCKELGVMPYWNILWGFPGEPAGEYERMAGLIPALTHLVPPVSCISLRLDRFSPNFDRASQLGFVDVLPYPAYHHVYPLAPEAVANLAYFFTFAYRSGQHPRDYTQCLADAVAGWHEAYPTSELLAVDRGDELLLLDTRPLAAEPLTVLEGQQRRLYLACDQARTLRQLAQIDSEHSDPPADAATIEQLLQPLVEQGLMLHDRGLYLSLAIPLGDYQPAPTTAERLHALCDGLGLPPGADLAARLAALDVEIGA